MDIELQLDTGMTKMKLEKEMEGNILGEGQLMGKYKR